VSEQANQAGLAAVRAQVMIVISSLFLSQARVARRLPKTFLGKDLRGIDAIWPSPDPEHLGSKHLHHGRGAKNLSTRKEQKAKLFCFGPTMNSNSGYLIAVLVAGIGCAQVLVPPLSTGGVTHLWPDDFRALDQQPLRSDLPCRVFPIKPSLDFDFFFHSGYTVVMSRREWSARETT
jgi:hypothetical protein